MKARSLILIGLVFSAIPASAYVRSEDSVTGACLFWTHRDIPWTMNDQGTADARFDDTKAALQRSFQTWQDVDCTDVTFEQQPTTSRIDVGFDPNKTDNINLVVWREKTCDLAVPAGDACLTAKKGEVTCADKYGCWSHSAGVIALTTTSFNRNTGVIADADIEFNGSADSSGNEFVFSATQADNLPTCARASDTNCIAMDVQNTATHEIGHLLGLDHSPVAEATMYASAPKGETKKRSLAPDDIEGVCDIYPQGQPPHTCTPSGHITISPAPSQRLGGCSAAGGSWGALAAGAGLLIARRRKNRGVQS